MSLSVCPVAKVKHKSERVLRVLSSHSVKCRISLSRRSQQVEGRMRMQTKKKNNKKIKVNLSATSLVIPDRTGQRIPSAD